MLTAPAEDTGLPWNVDVILHWYEHDSGVKIEDKNGTLHGVKWGPIRPEGLWKKYVVHITAGLSNWTSEDDDEAHLPYCNVGGWFDGTFLDWIDSLWGDEIMSTRDMDCFFPC